ncbi:MGDG synthase family glycosyltransferase [Bacillus vallismortis]|uniref:MGDG synthase family glycosyltransferase n=1 Tax=Bacillus vallismortis TaxID=72361 RepID=UPI000287A412|nr:glycosyl transferase [Bacillus vallismortis]MBG9770054.1 glycosyltransferase [Bacillus vallismortis]MEC1269500.1 glycosyltransferase [Bacillus vallismortis]QAV09156.1 glycosyltransferase [Bacillus vallismortis]
MKNILIFPFLSISTGHHHVADALQAELDSQGFASEKMDIFSHTYRRLEKLTSGAYLKWIQHFPKTYSGIYRLLACGQYQIDKRYTMYEWLFTQQMRHILNEKQPDFAFCTHALPSYLLNRLKPEYPDMTVVNVYTDFFVNQLWGRENIDYHFAPSIDIKMQLMSEGIDQKNIFMTGIPVHRMFERGSDDTCQHHPPYTIIITGGSMGVGGILKWVQDLSPGGNILYKILCGRNEKLYSYVKSLRHPLIEAIPYLHSKAEMNRLYEQASGIMTKPGGVTISECLQKRLPVFIYHALPGQEEMNVNLLKKRKLVTDMRNWNMQQAEERIEAFFQSNEQVKEYEKHVNEYLGEISDRKIEDVLKRLIRNKKHSLTQRV